jgi:hypothetical protein
MRLHLGFALAGLGYLIGIAMLSCAPNSALPAVVEVAFVRIPLYAGLALCLLLSIGRGAWERPPGVRQYWLVGLLGAGCAGAEALYRVWAHAGCHVMANFVVGLAGIVGLLVAHWLLGSQRKAART